MPFIVRHAFRSVAAGVRPHALAGNLTPLISHNWNPLRGLQASPIMLTEAIKPMGRGVWSLAPVLTAVPRARRARKSGFIAASMAVALWPERRRL
jgi:hypothetical protein